VHVSRDRLAPKIGFDGVLLAQELAEEAGLCWDVDVAAEVDRLAGAIFDELNTDPAPLPGARDLLVELEESDHLAWAIATSSGPLQVAASVAALRLPAQPPVTDAGHVERAKPAADLPLAAAAQLAVAPERCWYVGDSTWDMIAATTAGMAAIGITTGAVPADVLVDAGAVVALPSLTDVVEELERRGLIVAR